MAKQLIIVESPAKVKTIKKFLGPNYMVQASVGHVRDLPTSSLGVDEENGFAPQYEIIEKKKDLVNELRSAASKADTVFLAPDPDREGEAIAWHVAELIKGAARNIKRIQFNEITERAVKEAIAHPRELDTDLFEAQQARRILDRLVGYKISPLLWKTIKRGISAGRVQSVALKLIVEREEEREAFRPEEYWPFYARLKGQAPPPFRAELIKIGGKKARIQSAAEADSFEASIAGLPFAVESVEKKERSQAPQPPFITSTLQQAANQRLGYSAKRTMQIAQRLYEGVEIDDRGPVALITYMRTDSTRIADEAREAARAQIIAEYGEKFLPPKPRIYKAKSSSQDAHEAIRPVDASVTPELVHGKLPNDQFHLYNLIWRRFMASQMASARFDDTLVLINCGASQWRAKGEVTLFEGFLKAMPKSGKEESAVLPPLERGERLILEKLEKERKFTQPPARYTEAALVKKLEEEGIGRPSTYASIISTLQDRDYVRMEDKKLCPTDLGRLVSGELVKHFNQLMDTGFTAGMEKGLDRVAEGDENWVDLLNEFAAGFNPALESAAKNMRSMKGGVPAGLNCPECNEPLVIKFGKTGAFLACSAYPQCHYTSDFERNSDGSVEPVKREKPKEEKVGECPQCGSDLVIRKSHAGGKFIACSAFPNCKYAAPLGTGVACPECGKGQLVEKSSKKGKIFYACDQYPACKNAMWDKPLPRPCPLCGHPYLVEKKNRDGVRIMCPSKNCAYAEEGGDAQAED